MQPAIWEQWPYFFRGADRALVRIDRRQVWVDRMARWDVPDRGPAASDIEAPSRAIPSTAASRRFQNDWSGSTPDSLTPSAPGSFAPPPDHGGPFRDGVPLGPQSHT